MGRQPFDASKMTAGVNFKGKLWADPVVRGDGERFSVTFGFFYCYKSRDPATSSIIYKFVAWGDLGRHILSRYRKGDTIVIKRAYPVHANMKCTHCNKWHPGGIEWVVTEMGEEFEGLTPPIDDEPDYGDLSQEVLLEDDLPY